MRLTLSKNLEPIRLEACAEIDRQAERVRTLFITPGSGQSMVYQQKRVEALKVIDDPNVDPSEVPHIASEAMMNGIGLEEQANIILTMAQQWTEVSSMIEVRRLAAKQAVRAARTEAEIDQAKQVDWSDIKALA